MTAGSVDRALARLLCAFARALTGARSRWVGAVPAATQRIYYANHGSHGDFVLLWASLPEDLRVRTRPVAGADYWTRNALRRYVATRVLTACAVLAVVTFVVSRLLRRLGHGATSTVLLVLVTFDVAALLVLGVGLI